MAFILLIRVGFILYVSISSSEHRFLIEESQKNLVANLGAMRPRLPVATSIVEENALLSVL